MCSTVSNVSKARPFLFLSNESIGTQEISTEEQKGSALEDKVGLAYETS